MREHQVESSTDTRLFAPRTPTHVIAAAIVAACVLYFAWLLVWQLPRSPLINPDSLGYLVMSWHRGIGYPLFLEGLAGVTGNLYSVVVAQAVIVVAALVFAFFQAGQFYQRPALGLLASVPFLLSTTLIQYYWYIWSEALFLALCLVTLGAFFWALRRPRWLPLVLCGLAAGASLSVKPTGLTLILFPVALLVQLAGHRLRVVALCFPTFLLPVAGYMHYNAQHLGNPSPFLRGGMSLFAGTAHLHQEGAAGEHAAIINWLARETKRYTREIADAESFRERQHYKKEQHAHVAYAREGFEGLRDSLTEIAAAAPARYCAGVVMAESSEYHGTHHPDLCVDRLQREIAVSAIAAAPFGYLGYVLDNLYAYMRETYRHTKLDQHLFDTRRDDAYAIAERFNLNAPRASFAPDGEPPRIDVGLPLNRVHTPLHEKVVRDLRVYEILGLAGGVIMIGCTALWAWSLVFAVSRRRPVTRIMIGAGTLNASLLGMYLMMSLTHHVVVRYVDILQPMAALAAALGAILLLRFVAAKPWEGFPTQLFVCPPAAVERHHRT